MVPCKGTEPGSTPGRVSNVGRIMVGRWGDQWYWKVTVKLKTGDKAVHEDLTLHDANAIEREAKASPMTKSVKKERTGKRDT